MEERLQRHDDDVTIACMYDAGASIAIRGRSSDYAHTGTGDDDASSAEWRLATSAGGLHLVAS